MKSHRTLLIIPLLFTLSMVALNCGGDDDDPTPWLPGHIEEPNYSAALDGQFFSYYFWGVSPFSIDADAFTHRWIFDSSEKTIEFEHWGYDSTSQSLVNGFLCFKGTYKTTYSMLEYTFTERLAQSTEGFYRLPSTDLAGWERISIPYYADNERMMVGVFIKTSDNQNTLQGTWTMTKKQWENADSANGSFSQLQQHYDKTYTITFNADSTMEGRVVMNQWDLQTGAQADINYSISGMYRTESLTDGSDGLIISCDEIYSGNDIDLLKYEIIDHRLLTGVRLDLILEQHIRNTSGNSWQEYYILASQPLGLSIKSSSEE